MADEVLSVSEEEEVMEAIVRLDMQIKELTEKKETLKAFFKQRDKLYPAGTKKQVGKFELIVTSNTRVDDALAKRNLPTNRYRAVTKMSVDPVKARKYLTPEEYAQVVKTYDNRIEVKLR